MSRSPAELRLASIPDSLAGTPILARVRVPTGATGSRVGREPSEKGADR